MYAMFFILTLTKIHRFMIYDKVVIVVNTLKEIE